MFWDQRIKLGIKFVTIYDYIKNNVRKSWPALAGRDLRSLKAEDH